MVIIIVVLAILAFIGLLIVFIRLKRASNFVKRLSVGENTIVYGSKGSGKTLMFSILARSSKYGYASNTEFYHDNGVLIDPSDISCAPNTWENVLNGDIKPINCKPLLEKKPIFLDDAGVYVPNFAEYMLKTRYPSMPISFALWRHFYDAPIHINSQDIGRTWKLIREQQSAFVRCKGVLRFGFFGIVKCVYYDRVSGAIAEVEPIKRLAFNKQSKSEYEKFVSTYGNVRSLSVPFLYSHHKYNSRYFHNEFFGSNTYPLKKKYNKRMLKDMSNLQKLLGLMEKRKDTYIPSSRSFVDYSKVVVKPSPYNKLSEERYSGVRPS